MGKRATPRRDRGVSIDEALRMVLALPAVEQRAYGDDAIALRVRGKGFAYLNEAHDRAMVKAVRAEQEALVAADPEVFRPAWGSGQFAWVEVRLPGVTRAEFGELVTEAWRLTAPKRLVAAHEAARPRPPPQPRRPPPRQPRPPPRPWAAASRAPRTGRGPPTPRAHIAAPRSAVEAAH